MGNNRYHSPGYWMDRCIEHRSIAQDAPSPSIPQHHGFEHLTIQAPGFVLGWDRVERSWVAPLFAANARMCGLIKHSFCGDACVDYLEPGSEPGHAWAPAAETCAPIIVTFSLPDAIAANALGAEVVCLSHDSNAAVDSALEHMAQRNVVVVGGHPSQSVSVENVARRLAGEAVEVRHRIVNGGIAELAHHRGTLEQIWALATVEQ